jgi:hypothetical protein
MTVAARLQPARAWLNQLEPGIFTDLTWEQIADLRENIAETIGYDPSPEKLAEAVEATSPKLAADFRRRSPQEITNYVNLVLTFLQLMLTVYQIAGAVSPAQVNQIINHVETTVINQTTLVSPPSAPPAPAPADPPVAPPAPPATEGAPGDQP